jgi:hypothetical protein
MPEKPRSAKPSAGSPVHAPGTAHRVNVGHPTFIYHLSSHAPSADLFLVGMGEVPNVTVSLCALCSGAFTARAVSLTATDFCAAASYAPSDSFTP